MARIDKALTIRAKGFCNAASVGIGSRKRSGITIRKKSIAKKTPSNTSATIPHGAGRESGGCPSDSSSNANLSEDCAVVEASRCTAGPARTVRSRLFFDSPLAAGPKIDHPLNKFAETTATVAAQRVVKKDG